MIEYIENKQSIGPIDEILEVLHTLRKGKMIDTHGKFHTYKETMLDNARLRWSTDGLLAFGTQVRGFKPHRSRRIFQSEKNPQHAFLRRESKAVCPMS